MIALVIPLVAFVSASATKGADALAFEKAMVAAIHHFAQEGELDHLKAIVEKYPNSSTACRHFPPTASRLSPIHTWRFFVPCAAVIPVLMPAIPS